VTTRRHSDCLLIQEQRGSVMFVPLLHNSMKSKTMERQGALPFRRGRLDEYKEKFRIRNFYGPSPLTWSRGAARLKLRSRQSPVAAGLVMQRRWRSSAGPEMRGSLQTSVLKSSPADVGGGVSCTSFSDSLPVSATWKLRLPT
jgi:hypothetical protein